MDAPWEMPPCSGEYDGEEITVEAELNTSGIQGNGEDNDEVGGDGDEIIIPGEARTNGSYNLHEGMTSIINRY